MGFTTKRLKRCKVLTPGGVNCCVQFCQVRDTAPTTSALAACTHEHKAGAVTLQRIIILLGKDLNPNNNFSLKVLAGKELHNKVVVASVFETNCRKRSSESHGDELLQDSLLPPLF